MYDRYIVANRNSNLRRHGDKFRGDLPIMPRRCGWWDPPVHPGIDLEPGAMNVMGGIYNESAMALAELINRTSDHSILGGVDLASPESMATMKNVKASQSLSTVNISAF